MTKYNKLFVALIGVAVMLLKDHVGVDLSAMEPELVNTLVGLLTAFGVWAVPNTQPATDTGVNYNEK